MVHQLGFSLKQSCIHYLLALNYSHHSQLLEHPLFTLLHIIWFQGQFISTAMISTYCHQRLFIVNLIKRADR